MLKITYWVSHGPSIRWPTEVSIAEFVYFNWIEYLASSIEVTAKAETEDVEASVQPLRPVPE